MLVIVVAGSVGYRLGFCMCLPSLVVLMAWLVLLVLVTSWLLLVLRLLPRLYLLICCIGRKPLLSREESAHAFGEEPEQQEEEQQQQQEEEQQQQQQQQQQQATFNVSVPPGMGPGQLVQIRHPPCGQMLTARQIPPGVYAGQVFSAPLGATPALQQQAPMQFAVEVPPGVVAGQRLQILHPATGQVMQVQVPAWAYAGMRFMVQG